MIFNKKRKSVKMVGISVIYIQIKRFHRRIFVKSNKINDMKRISFFTAALLMILVAVSCTQKENNSTNDQNATTMEKTTISNEPILGLGKTVSDNFTGEAWLNMLSTVPENDCFVYNVTFAPGARNYWHSHSVGQILLCTEGVGYYQEKDKSAQRLSVGDVVNIPANAMHWHGAAPDSRFTHIGITPKVSENSAEWGGMVTDEEYAEATK